MATNRGPAHLYGSNKDLASWKWSLGVSGRVWLGPIWLDPPVFAIDPGISNVGVCTMRFEHPIVCERMSFKGDDSLVRAYDFGVALNPTPMTTVVIEGPAHGKQFGQPQLAEMRAAFKLGIGVDRVQVVPPNTARKDVLGYAFFKGHDIWPLLDPNAADAVVLALWGAGYRWSE